MAETGTGEEVGDQRRAITIWEAESSCEWRDHVRNHRGILEVPGDDLGRDARNLRRIYMVGKEIADHPLRAGGRQSMEDDAELARNPTSVQTHVWPRRLPPVRQRELMDISAEVARTVERRRGRVRDERDLVVCQTRPCLLARIQLKPGSPEGQVVRLAAGNHTVDAVGDALEDTVRHQ